MRTIAVVGVGTVGVLSLAHFLTYMPDEFEIVSIHDPSIPIFGIGESTPINPPDIFWKAADWSLFEAANELDATVKFGIKYTNWREHEIFSHVQPPSYGIHLNNFKIKDVFFPRFQKKWKNKFKIIETKITDLKNVDNSVDVYTDKGVFNYDYVVDCRGWPESYDDYVISKAAPLNSCLVQMIPEPGDWNYTHHVAHKNGWMFGIPLKTRQGWGYLYNDTITTKEEATEHIKELFNKDEVNLKEFKFKNFYAKKMLEGRIIKNGNRAMFMEPLEGFSGSYYYRVLQVFTDFIYGIMNEDRVNEQLVWDAQDAESVMSFIYHGGSNFDSPFWNHAKQITSEHLKNSERFNRYIIGDINNMNRIQRMTEVRSPLSVSLWENHDKKFGYHYFTPKD